MSCEGSAKLSEIGEFALIERMSRKRQKVLPAGMLGIGDDCAVIPLKLLKQLAPGEQGNLLLTTDLMVENRHFRLSYFRPVDIGWKLLAVNISDIAAMGGRPLAALVTLQLPKETELSFVEELYEGLYQHAEKYSITIIGGDTCAGSEIAVGVTLLGLSQNKPVLRSGAKVGDGIWISGTPGLASIGFDILEKSRVTELGSEIYLEQFFRPQPKVELASTLLERQIASAMIDISDGTLQDLGHILQASNLSAQIDLQSVPASPDDKDKCAALTGGEDYQLLFTAAREMDEQIFALSGIQLSRIGTVLAPMPQPITLKLGERIVPAEDYLKSCGKPGSGYQHF